MRIRLRTGQDGSRRPDRARGKDSSDGRIGDTPRLDSPKDEYATGGVPAVYQGDVVVEADPKLDRPSRKGLVSGQD